MSTCYTLYNPSTLTGWQPAALGLVDVSYCNDVAARFTSERYADSDQDVFEAVPFLWAAEADAADREYPDEPRFWLTAGGHTVWEGETLPANFAILWAAAVSLAETVQMRGEK